ncbi:MAG TPA: putative DNA binding domain-containing protein, partial [Candidatus Wallbacteria bacterium]|nr:putative DNA binding domain-containing protein [Candidatus Wallbacteria bacterium]
MKSKDEILKIIDMLDRHSADHFEGQDLDFKEWTSRSMKDMVDKVVKYAVCMANGGGGTVVFGVKDK